MVDPNTWVFGAGTFKGLSVDSTGTKVEARYGGGIDWSDSSTVVANWLSADTTEWATENYNVEDVLITRCFPDPDTVFKPVCIPYTPVKISENSATGLAVGDYDFSMLTLSETGAAVDASVDWSGPGFSRQPLRMKPVINQDGGVHPKFFDYAKQGTAAADC